MIIDNTQKTAVKMPPVMPMPLLGVDLAISRATTEDGEELIDLTMAGSEMITIDSSGNPLLAGRPILHYYMKVEDVREFREKLGEIIGQTNGIILPTDLR